MTPTAWRLDTLAVQLIDRLEPARRTHVDEARAADAIRAVVSEAALAVARECRETSGDEAQARRIEKEALETFLPRYTRLALAQNAKERGGGLLADNVLARVFATALAFLLAVIVSRIVHHWVDLLFFAAAALTPLAPELRTWGSRRAYRRQLQELADDMGRIEDAAAALPLAEPTKAPEPEPPPKARRRDTEVN
ncbi:MAG: hypothetical protein ACOZNI_25255 [Myxococcota bacterium]